MDAFEVVRLITLIMWGLSLAWWAYCVRWTRYGTGGRSNRVSEQTYRLARATSLVAGIIFIVVNVLWIYHVVR